jgi:hypothetical protein
VADQAAGEPPAAAGPTAAAVPVDAAAVPVDGAAVLVDATAAPDDGAAVPIEDAAGDRAAGPSPADTSPADTSPVEGAPGDAAAVVTRHREHRFPRRRRPVHVRFGEDEFAAIELAAGRAGLTPTGYVGAVALATARGTVPPAPAPSQSREALVELMAARAQVRRFGGNVNQAVAQLHSTGEAPQWLAPAVELTARAVARVDAAAEVLMRRRPESRP